MLKPFKSIRNFFHNALAILKEPGCRFVDIDFVESNWPTFSTYSSKRTENLTQRDLQLLQNIMAKHIKVVDQVRKEIKEEALQYEVGDDLRNILFREHREVKAHLKKLTALQHKLKHKIVVVN